MVWWYAGRASLPLMKPPWQPCASMMPACCTTGLACEGSSALQNGESVSIAQRAYRQSGPPEPRAYMQPQRTVPTLARAGSVLEWRAAYLYYYIASASDSAHIKAGRVSRCYTPTLRAEGLDGWTTRHRDCAAITAAISGNRGRRTSRFGGRLR